MAATENPTGSSIVLPDDVYEDLADFRENAREILATVTSDGTDEVIENAVSLISDLIGKDPVKLFALVDLVHAKIINIKQWNWATGAAVKIYK
jgi:hypothetical protein